MSKVTKLHPYDKLPGASHLNGIPVHLSTLVRKAFHGVEVISKWYERKWFMPWNNIRPKVYYLPSVWVVDTPMFGTRIMVHPDLYRELMEGIETPQDLA